MICLPGRTLLLENVVNMSTNVRAMKSAEYQALAHNFLSVFTETAFSVFQITASTQLHQKEVFIRTDQQPSGDVSAIIVFDAEKVAGSVAISFPESSFLKVVSRILGEEFTSLGQGIESAAGELCNQIYGSAKRLLAEKGYKLPLALPTVVRGANHSVEHYVRGECLTVRFETELGPVLLECVVQDKTAKAA